MSYRAVNTEIDPTPIAIGDAISHAVQAWQRHLGLLVGTTLVSGFIVGIFRGIARAMLLFSMGPDREEPGDAFFMIIRGLAILELVSYLFFEIGMGRIALAVARDENPSFDMLFSGIPWLFPILIASTVFWVFVVAGLAMFLVPGLLLALWCWTYRWLIIDDEAGTFTSFLVANRLSSGNVAATVLLGFSGILLYLIGVAACCVGVIFTTPLFNVCCATAYLMMTGQLVHREDLDDGGRTRLRRY